MVGARPRVSGVVFLGLLSFIRVSVAKQSGQLSTQLQDGLIQITHWLNEGLLKISGENLSHPATQVRTGITDNRGAWPAKP